MEKISANEIYALYKLGSLWSTIGDAAKGFAKAIGHGGSTIGEAIGAVGKGIAAHPGLAIGSAAAIGGGALAGNLLGNAMAPTEEQKNQAEGVIRNLINQTSDMEVKTRLNDLIAGMDNGTVNVNTVVAILRQGNLM